MASGLHVVSIMEASMKCIASAGTPLQTVSPERANRQIVPQSPALAADPSVRLRDDPFTTSRNSDVLVKVQQFNNMSKEQKRKDNEAALRRAVVGREEAEDETKSLREDRERMKAEIDEGKSRERKVAQRLESVMVRIEDTIDAHGLTSHRKKCRDSRRPEPVHRHSMKRKSEEHGKKLSSLRAPSLDSRRS